MFFLMCVLNLFIYSVRAIFVGGWCNKSRRVIFGLNLESGRGRGENSV